MYLWRQGVNTKIHLLEIAVKCEPIMSFHDTVISMQNPLKKRTFLVQLNTCTCKIALMRKCYLLTLSISGSSNFTFPLKEPTSSVLAKTCKIIIHFIQLKWKGIFKFGIEYSTVSCMILVVCIPMLLTYFFDHV